MNSIFAHRRVPDKLAHQGSVVSTTLRRRNWRCCNRQDEAALHRANAHLERRVRARTALTQTNAALLARKSGAQAGGARTDPAVRARAKPASAAGGTTARRAPGERGAAQGGASPRQNSLQVVASLLDMQADTIEDRSIRALFEDSQQRIQSIALIHESLYLSGDVMAQVNAAEYLPQLSQRLFEAYRSPIDHLTLKVQAEPVWLTVQTAVPCGLLITELVTNSFKHAFPNGLVGEIHITLRQDPAGACVLIVGDTGVGLPEGLDTRATASLGWQLVRLLTEQLRGSMALEGYGGTTVTITFPL